MIQTIFGSPVVILKNNKIEDLISKSVYEDIIDYLMQPKNKFKDHLNTRGGDICTTDLSSDMKADTISGVNVLIEFLKETALPYAGLYSTLPVKDLKFSYYWINLMFQGCEINNHIDQNSKDDKRLIVTIYPKAPVGGAELVFIHDGKGDEWVSDCLEKDLVRITIEEGDIVIFDTFSLHAVDTHKITESRMCIAVEFIIET
jgi:hypothetical protein